MIESVTPHLAAHRKAQFYASTGLAPEQVEGMYLGTWLACQARLELGSSATIDSIHDYAMSVLQPGEVAGLFVAAAAVEVCFGDYGIIVDASDADFQAKQSVLAGLAAKAGQLMNRQGDK